MFPSSDPHICRCPLLQLRGCFLPEHGIWLCWHSLVQHWGWPAAYCPAPSTRRWLLGRHRRSLGRHLKGQGPQPQHPDSRHNTGRLTPSVDCASATGEPLLQQAACQCCSVSSCFWLSSAIAQVLTNVLKTQAKWSSIRPCTSPSKTSVPECEVTSSCWIVLMGFFEVLSHSFVCPPQCP